MVPQSERQKYKMASLEVRAGRAGTARCSAVAPVGLLLMSLITLTAVRSCVEGSHGMSTWRQRCGGEASSASNAGTQHL